MQLKIQFPELWRIWHYLCKRMTHVLHQGSFVFIRNIWIFVADEFKAVSVANRSLLMFVQNLCIRWTDECLSDVHRYLILINDACRLKMKLEWSEVWPGDHGFSLNYLWYIFCLPYYSWSQCYANFAWWDQLSYHYRNPHTF